MRYEARRLVVSLRARSALEFVRWAAGRSRVRQPDWQQIMSMDPRTITDRFRVTGAQEGPC
jgi:hypothetical protein